MTEKEETVEFEDVECVYETHDDRGHSLALCCKGITEHDEWIPQSQIHMDSEVYRDGDKGTLIVTRWFAEKKGWV